MSRRTAGLLLLPAICLAAIVYVADVAIVSQRAIAHAQQAVQPVDSVTQVATGSSEARSGPLLLDDDSCQWLLLSEQGLREHTLRVRATHVDNVPFGREVHWSSGPIWFIQSVGTVISTISQKPLHDSLAIAALWWNPFVHCLLVILACMLLFGSGRWKLGLLAGIALATLPSLHFTCHTARPDHHCLQALFLLVSLMLPILAGLGWTTASDTKSTGNLWPVKTARVWMVAGGIVAGAGLWVGAIVETVGLLGFGTGLLGWFCSERRPLSASDEVLFQPGLWRWWGWSGAVSSLGFYFLEYFPSHMGMRLEVNHPWYAMCLAAAGEIFFRLGRIVFERRSWKGESTALSISFLCLASLPIALWLGPSAWLALRDPWIKRMHDLILEFQPYSVAFGGSNFWKTFGILPTFMIVGIYGWRRNATESWERGGLLVAGGAASLLLVCLLLQNRWAVFFAVAIVLFAILSCQALKAGSLFSRACNWGLLLQSLLYGWLVVATAQRFGVQHADPQFLASVIAQRTAVEFQKLTGSAEWRIFSEPGNGPMYAYYMGGSVLTSLYWENGDGLAAATLFMTDGADEDAKRVAKERGLTHIFLPENADAAKFYQHVRYGAIDLDRAKASMAGRLSRRKPPDWLKLNESMTEIGQSKYRMGQFVRNQTLLVYDVDQEAIK